MILINSVYGLEHKSNPKLEKYYEMQRKKAIAILGDKYLLATQIKRNDNEQKK